MYQGALSQGRGVRLLLDAFQERQNDPAVIVFMGYGELEAEVRELADRHTNIFYFPAVAPDVVLEFTASADAGIHVIQNTCLNHFYCMPNKLFEYAMAGLPVVVSNMKDMSQFVAQHNMGAVVKELSPAFINQAIDELLAGDLLKMSKNARKIVENSFDEEIVINEVLLTLDSL